MYEQKGRVAKEGELWCSLLAVTMGRQWTAMAAKGINDVYSWRDP